jgi:hypothetical protein
MTPLVRLDSLEAAARDRGPVAYVITVSDRGTPHAVLAEVARKGTTVVVDVGERTAAHAASRPHVSLLYPIRHPGDYSLIVDAVATVARTPTGGRLTLVPTRAVLHRPGAPSDRPASSCGSDCVPLALEDPS